MSVSMPLTPDEVMALIGRMQTLRSELPEAEAKDGRRGLPQRLYESISALSNRRGGGAIIFGLEDSTFRVLAGLDIAKLQPDLASFVDQRMSYPLRLEFTACSIDTGTVLAVGVPECPPAHKPVYYKGKGLIGGSYVRVGNTNHELTDPEVRAILRSTDRDDTDTTPVPGSTIGDLSVDLVAAYRETLRATRPGSNVLGLGDIDLLQAVRAVTRVGEDLVPTVAGCLFFCLDPQRLLPGVFMSFLQFAGTDVAEVASGPAYLDNVRIDGPIPAMIEEARRLIFSRIRKRALLEGFVRREIPEYPDWAYREAVVNAVAHRDYAIAGGHTQVRMFADRLEVQSPGGLFGTVSEQNIEFEQSTRNHAIVRLLEDHGLVEQRGIGINRMVQAMLEGGLERPQFRDSLTSFLVILKNHTMMDDDALRWLSSFADIRLSDQQRIALVYAWRTGTLANRDYVRLNSITSVRATTELRDLVRKGLLNQHGTRGAAYYTLARIPVPTRRRPLSIGAHEEMVLAYVRQQGRITNGEGRELLDITEVWRMRQILRRMVRLGLLEQLGESKQATYYVLNRVTAVPRGARLTRTAG
jgi:ATP-dependent DNA helicase RecG